MQVKVGTTKCKKRHLLPKICLCLVVYVAWGRVTKPMGVVFEIHFQCSLLPGSGGSTRKNAFHEPLNSVNKRIEHKIVIADKL